MMVIISIMISASLIGLASWYSGINPRMAGFITALPLTSLLALIASQLQWRNSINTLEYAKSIFYSLPLTSLFFIPFLLAEKFSLGFWTCYISGFLLLGCGYVVARHFFHVS
jgi:hypothetical protein